MKRIILILITVLAVAGALDNGLIISSGGCQIAHGVKGRLNVMTVCEDGGG